MSPPMLFGRQLPDKGALPPPDGIDPNFIDPPNRNDMTIGIVVFLMIITSTLLLLRAYTKLVIAKKVQLEDFFGLAAFLCFLGYFVCVFLFRDNTGYFVHQWNIKLRKLPRFAHIILVGSNFYAVNMLCIKVAIMLEWLRIFVPGKARNTFFWACWAILLLNTLFYIANVIALDLACIPHRAIWDITIKGHCVNNRALNTASAVTNLISDIGLFALAQKVIWKLQMSLRRKIGVSIIFAMGLIGCVAGAFRLAVTITYQKNEDLTYTVSNVILWAVGEMTAGMLIFCVPALPKLFSTPGLPSRIASALRSWSGISSSKGSAAQESSDMAGHSGSYRRFDKNEVPLTNLSESHEDLRASAASPSADGIVRTTHLTTSTQQDTYGGVAADRHTRQHPWME